MDEISKIIIPIMVTIMISTIPMVGFAANNNINNLTTITSPKTILSLPLKLISNNNGSGINQKLNNTNNDVTSNNTNSSKSVIKVVASFFPIYEFVKAVGGDRVQASVLIPIGSEPHSFDPTIQQISNAQTADMLVYNGAGMESVWINKVNPKFAVDTSQGLNLLASGDKKALTGVDPHIWLDPILAEHQANMIRDGLIKVDPNNANYYKDNAQKFIAQLNSLNSSIKSKLSNCNKKDFISFHNAFNYFAQRYGLIQHTIQGLSPEGEILPQKIQEIIQLSHNLGINTIYSEDLVDPRAAQVIADEIPNGKVLILSPIEGIKPVEQKAGIGYLDKMKQDLTNLEEGLQCSSNNSGQNPATS
ncbi:MAG: zinc ABC transporter substrate-binding protein [Candidatus Nitrosocosmicus sp.]